MKTYEEFRNALGHRESTNNYRSENNGGCVGRYQFCPGTLQSYSQKILGRNISKAEFKDNPALQDKFFDELVKDNAGVLINYLELAKKTVGPFVTLSGLVAGAHLGGTGSEQNKKGVIGLVKYSKDRADRNKTKISDYIKEFSGYCIPGYTQECGESFPPVFVPEPPPKPIYPHPIGTEEQKSDSLLIPVVIGVAVLAVYFLIED